MNRVWVCVWVCKRGEVRGLFADAHRSVRPSSLSFFNGHYRDSGSGRIDRAEHEGAQERRWRSAWHRALSQAKIEIKITHTLILHIQYGR